MNSIDVSVVIPLYNVEPYIHECLLSVTSQTLKNIEIIIIDDGSTDASLKISQNFAKKDPRIKIYSQINSGSGAARNKGIDNSTGRYISFVDPDDMYASKDSLEILYKNAILKNADLCGGNFLVKNKEKLDDGYSVKNRFKKDEFVKNDYVPNTDGFFWRFLFSAEFIKLNGIRFPNYRRGQDAVFLISCYSFNPAVQTIVDNVYIYRINHKTIQWSKIKTVDWLKSIYDIVKIAEKCKFYELETNMIVWAKKELKKILAENQEYDLSKEIESLNKEINWKKLSVMICEKIEEFNKYYSVTPQFQDSYIVIVLCADKNFIKYLSVTLESIVARSKKSLNYDINILLTSYSFDDIEMLNSQIVNHPNIKLRFINMENYIDDFPNSISSGHLHFTLATYFRFYIPAIFKAYKKVLYLDSDIIIEDCLLELFETDLGQNYFAAVRDVWTISSYYEGSFYSYINNELNIRTPDNYYNTGVLLFNLEEINKTNFLDKMHSSLKQIGVPRLADQDVFNSVYQNKIKFLDFRWNFTVHALTDTNLHKYLPGNLYDSFYDSSANPKIIHFTSEKKPWNTTEVLYRSRFWDFAKKSPYYHDILINNKIVKKETYEEKDEKGNKNLSSGYLSVKYIRLFLMSKLMFGHARKHYKNKLKNLKI